MAKIFRDSLDSSLCIATLITAIKQSDVDLFLSCSCLTIFWRTEARLSTAVVQLKLLAKFDQTGETIFMNEVAFSIYVFFTSVNFNDILHRVKNQWFEEKTSPSIWKRPECWLSAKLLEYIPDKFLLIGRILEENAFSLIRGSAMNFC